MPLAMILPIHSSFTFVCLSRFSTPLIEARNIAPRFLALRALASRVSSVPFLHVSLLLRFWQATLRSSGNKTLTFEYVVQEGDSASDLDYASSSALSLNGGTWDVR